MAIVITKAEVPDELMQQWLQHLRDFDVAHPGCHFEIMASTAQSMDDALMAMSVNPAFRYRWAIPKK